MLEMTLRGFSSFVERYRGTYTVTLWPRYASAGGSAPITSANPPVFENGTHSDAAKAICMGPPDYAESISDISSRHKPRRTIKMFIRARKLSLIAQSKEGQRAKARGEFADG